MNSELEAAIAAKPGPKVTPQQIVDAIVAYDYFEHGTLTICVATLRNGYKVTGESACADPANYDMQIGRTLANKQAREKVWVLEGYLLRQRLHEEGK